MAADKLTLALEGLLQRRRRAHARQQQTGAPPLLAQPATAFEAVLQERLRLLEQELAEVRNRVAGLLFLVAGAVLAQLVLRLLETR